VANLKANHDSISFTVRLPRDAWLKELQSPADHPRTDVLLLRARLTRDEALVAIQMVGPSRALREAVSSWTSRGFRVEPDHPKGLRNPEV
jgi:hypothetical protein